MTRNNEKLRLTINKNELHKTKFIFGAIYELDSLKNTSPYLYFVATKNIAFGNSGFKCEYEFSLPMMDLIHDKILICEKYIYTYQHTFPIWLTSNLKHVYKYLDDIYTKHLADK